MNPNNETAMTRRAFLGSSAKLSAALAIAGPISFIGCEQGNTVFDTLIKNGTIFDGTASKPYLADIGIKGDKIISIGKLDGSSTQVIDATGLTVTPGFIDIHTHCDLTFQRTGIKRYLAYVMPSFKGNHNYMYQGVSTVVTGNCGYGYTDTAFWLDLVDTMTFGSNVLHLAPHGMIRKELFGDNQPTELSTKQLDAMKTRVAEEMEKGAVGFSTGLEYAPGLQASTRELIEINKVVSQYGGLHTTHIRDLTGKIMANGGFGIVQALQEAVEIGKRAEISTQISHLTLKAPYNGVSSGQLFDVIEQAQLDGMDILADQFPYTAGATLLSARLPAEFKSDAGIKDQYKTKEGRLLVKKAIEERFLFSGPEQILIAMYPENESFEGRTLNEIAQEKGKQPADLYVDLVAEDISPIAVFFDHHPDVFRDILTKDYVITASDSWTIPKDMSKPHPQAFGTFPKKLRQYAIDEKIIDFQAAIRSMTSLPAEKFKIKNRGTIEKGNYADLVVMNLDTIRDHSTYKKPHQYSEGIVHLFVNGVHSIRHGKTTGDRGGRSIRRDDR